MRYTTLYLVVLLIAPSAYAETFRYKLYELSDSGNRILLAADAVEYTLRDIRVSAHRKQSNRETYWQKSLRLQKNFMVSAMITREQQLKGFGLQVTNSREPLGFSWEWFNRAEAEEFEKLQGGTRVRVGIRQIGDKVELAVIEFLEDTVLRFQKNILLDNHRKTHEVHVEKGSVLRFVL